MKNGGICLTFDDYSIDDWASVAPMLRRYQAKATFYISHFPMIEPALLTKLHMLDSFGHEIGYHTISHPRVSDYLKSHSIEHYFHHEIERGLTLMKEAGFNPKSFAYPFNDATPESQSFLAKHFTTLRTVAHSVDDALFPPTGNKFIRGKSIDMHSETRSLWPKTVDDIVEDLVVAKRKNLVAVFYAHRVTDELNNQTRMTPAGLEFIVSHAAKFGMKFFTASELS